MRSNLLLSKYLGQIVYGGSDGIITTFAVVAGFAGAQNESIQMYPMAVVLLFGFANLFADATSMGIGNFLSVRSESSLIKKNGGYSKAFFTSIATFLAFIIFGLIPLAPYIFIQNFNTTFKLSVFFTFLALLIIGLFRWKVTKEGILRSVGEVVLLGGASATVAYFVGTFFRI